MEKTVNILGTVYTIKEQSEKDNKLLEGCDGYCDYTTKEIVVEREIEGTLQDMEVYIRKVLRHEIVHAFLLESGLAECSGGTDCCGECKRGNLGIVKPDDFCSYGERKDDD